MTFWLRGQAAGGVFPLFDASSTLVPWVGVRSQSGFATILLAPALDLSGALPTIATAIAHWVHPLRALHRPLERLLALETTAHDPCKLALGSRHRKFPPTPGVSQTCVAW